MNQAWRRKGGTARSPLWSPPQPQPPPSSLPAGGGGRGRGEVEEEGGCGHAERDEEEDLLGGRRGARALPASAAGELGICMCHFFSILL